MIGDLKAKAAALRATVQAPARQPPQDEGRRLATIQRSESEEVRLSWCEWNGKPFVNLRLWTRDASGGWWPSKDKGMTVKVRELADLADGIGEALDLALELQAQKGGRS